MGLVLVPILIHWPNFPRMFAEAILGGIALLTLLALLCASVSPW